MPRPSSWPRLAQRAAITLAVVFALVLQLAAPSFAALTGTLSGTVTDAKSGAPLAGVSVDAASPTQHAHTTTDAKGFFSVTGLQPDTYTVSFSLNGFETGTLNGVTVIENQTQTITQGLSRQLKTIGRVAAHSSGSAYQPTQTVDNYTVTSSQIATVQGRENNNNEVTLVGSLPGAEVDASGYPSIRGGRENEIGFQFEGINYIEPYSNQFANSLLTNGVGSLQFSPGAGNASQGNNGTGTINLIAKRGTFPGFGQLEFESGTQTYWHDLRAEYGFATPNGRFSNYFSFLGQRQAELYGNHNNNLTQINEFDGNSYNVVNDFIDNLIYKFGKDQSQSIQLFYQGQVVQYQVGAGLQAGSSFYRSGDPGSLKSYTNVLNVLSGNVPFTPATVQQIFPLYPGQTDVNQQLQRNPAYNQPLQAFKLQYNNNLNASTYFNVRLTRLSAVTTFDFPFTVPYPFGSNAYQILQGGGSTAFGADLSKQINAKNLLQVGATYSLDTPVYSYYAERGGLFDTLGLGELGGFASSGQGAEAYDFVNPTTPACVSGLAAGSCGYLYGNYPAGSPKAGQPFFANGVPRIPAPVTNEPYTRHTYSAYADDNLTFSSKLRADLGLRLDGAKYEFGDLEKQFGIPNGTNKEITPSIVQPRLAASYQFDPSNALRVSFGRSIQFPFFSNLVNTIDPAGLQQFAGIPAYDNLSGNQALGSNVINGGTVNFCGPKFNAPCKDYADQLYWEYQANNGPQVTPIRPEQFSNWDFSISHQFKNNVALKLTPFYRSGQDINVASSPIIGKDPITGNPLYGPAVSSNVGITKTTGLEMLLTKDAQYGFSGQLSATYINEFSNIPPLASSEDFAPSVSPDSLALGKTYRVGFLSPFVAQLSTQYRTRSGWRINPVIQYTRGYPINEGTTLAYNVNGQSIIVPNTNLTSFNGAPVAPQYVDPANPGSYLRPNIVATRGTAESPDAGGVLSNARFQTNLTLEYSPPKSRVTYGVTAYGLFNNVFGYPVVNDCYQPVISGISGPQSGTGVCAYSQQPYGNGRNQYVNIRGDQPYLLIPNNNFSFTAQSEQTPLLTVFYVQVKL